MVFGKKSSGKEIPEFVKALKNLFSGGQSAYSYASPYMGPNGAGSVIMLDIIAVYQVMLHFSSKYEELQKEVSKKEKFYGKIMDEMSKKFPGDYYAVFKSFETKQTSDRNEMVTRLICLMAFSALAKRFQGIETGLDVSNTADLLLPYLSETKVIGQVTSVDNIESINRWTRRFWERRHLGVPQTSVPYSPPISINRTYPAGFSPIPKPEEFFKRGKEFQRTGAFARAEEFIGKAEDSKLQELINKKPMGQGLTDAEKYRQEREKVHEIRVSPTHTTAIQEEDEEEDDEKFDFESRIISELPPVFFSDIIGNEAAKRALKDALVLPTKKPNFFPGGFPSRILFYGPPGCGKTLLAAAVTREIGGTFLEVDAADIMSRYVGAGERNVGELFDKGRNLAKSGKPVVIFMDELDDLLSKQFEHESTIKVRNQFQRELDGLVTKGKSQLQLFFIGATNKPWQLNEAMIRRFEKRVYVELPDQNDRIALFKMYLGKLSQQYEIDSGVNYEELTKMTDGYSADDIKNICKDVQYIVLHDMEEKGLLEKAEKPRKITMEDCLKAATSRKTSVTAEDLEKQKEWQKKYGAE